MKELFLVEDSLANKISYYHLMLFMGSLPFDRFYSHLILISLCIHTLIHFNKKNVKPILTINNLVLSSVFLVTLVSTAYSINRPEGFTEWGKQITILLFPVLFCLMPLDIKKYRAQLLLFFSIVCTLVVVYLYYDAFRAIAHYKLPYDSIFSRAFTNQNFSAPIDMHATFFSMQIGIALVYLLSVLIKEDLRPYRFFYIICILILLAGVIQLSSKSVFVALFLIIGFALPFFMLHGKGRIKFMLITASATGLILFAILFQNNLRTRYIADLKYDLSFTSANQTFDSRLDRWKVGAYIIQRSPIIGHGAGSEIGLLHEGFFNKKYYNSFLNNLNVHSEYLSFLIKSGLAGLIIYICTLVYGFKAAIKNKDLLFFAFMMLVAIVSFSENLLDVDKGIIFYAFFFSFFMFGNIEKRFLV